MTTHIVRLLAISLALAIAPPSAPAFAGWRDGPYYGDDGGAQDYYPPTRTYRDDYYRQPGAGYQAYAPSYYDDPDYYPPDDDGGPTVRPRMHRPPRNVSVAPARRLAPLKPRIVGSGPPRTDLRNRNFGTTAPAANTSPSVVAKVLPVPRPNLESMDFEATAAPK